MRITHQRCLLAPQPRCREQRRQRQQIHYRARHALSELASRIHPASKHDSNDHSSAMHIAAGLLDSATRSYNYLQTTTKYNQGETP
jgi:cytidylate kinase